MDMVSPFIWLCPCAAIFTPQPPPSPLVISGLDDPYDTLPPDDLSIHHLLTKPQDVEFCLQRP